jgi:hypothetical protein
LAPFQLNHLRLRNRIVSTTHEPAYADDGVPKLRYQRYREPPGRCVLVYDDHGAQQALSTAECLSRWVPTWNPPRPTGRWDRK